MAKAKVLFVSQEITPFMDDSPMAVIARTLPQGIQEKGKEIRTFMPKFGCVNERRHQLHEVIRLSGMNLIINDTDHPLIIKVASIQPARMQVYFIDNEEYFERKFVFRGASSKFFADNDERSIFFCRGVLETVKKLGWSPDIVHCHGWITNLIPLYLKQAFNEDPVFMNTKVVYSVYDDYFKEILHKDFNQKAMIAGVDKKTLGNVSTADFVNINKLAVKMSDGIVLAGKNIDPEIEKYARKSNKPVLKHTHDGDYIDSYSDFYDELLVDEGVLIG